jgi:MFS family permease
MSYVTALTYIHTLISLIALGLGIPVVASLFGGRYPGRWTTWFLVTAIATSVTGFFFPFGVVTPAMIVGVIALIILAAVLVARYVFHLRGHWRWIYASGMVISVYLLAFVGVVQAFQKVPLIHDLAPTQTELPFLIAQVATLAAFLLLCVLAGIKFTGMVDEMVEGQQARW